MVSLRTQSGAKPMIALKALTAVMMCLTATACLTKLSSATDPVRTFDDFATISQCPSFQTYRDYVEPAMQQLCVSCHTSGARGGAKFAIYQGSSDDDEMVAKNYVLVKAKSSPESGSSGEIDSTVTLLNRLNGGVTHDLNLGILNDDYSSIRYWVQTELSQTCTINPVTGEITIGSSSSN